MSLAIVFYIRVADIYPETNRSRTLTVFYGVERAKEANGGYSASRLSRTFIDGCIRPLKSIETFSAELEPVSDENYVQQEGNKMQMPVTVKYVDTAYWNVFRFNFIEGAPFTVADFLSGVPSAVITQSLARKLYGEKEATGQSLSLNFRQFRVCGVVRDASFLTPDSYSQIWAPYSVPDMLDDSETFKGAMENTSVANGTGFLGNYKAYILAHSASDLKRVKQEFEESFKKYSGQFFDYSISLPNQPLRRWQELFFSYSTQQQNFNHDILTYGLIFLLLLLVPAISLSGMADSRMERRIAEMGVRRAFGAPTSSLMNQILFENFILTILGGALGLVLSYVLVITGKEWIMGVVQHGLQTQRDYADISMTPDMLLNLSVFFITLLVCFLLNLFSAIYPAWRASRRQIVNSLNLK